MIEKQESQVVLSCSEQPAPAVDKPQPALLPAPIKQSESRKRADLPRFAFLPGGSVLFLLVFAAFAAQAQRVEVVRTSIAAALAARMAPLSKTAVETQVAQADALVKLGRYPEALAGCDALAGSLKGRFGPKDNRLAYVEAEKASIFAWKMLPARPPYGRPIAADGQAAEQAAVDAVVARQSLAQTPCGLADQLTSLAERWRNDKSLALLDEAIGLREAGQPGFEPLWDMYLQASRDAAASGLRARAAAYYRRAYQLMGPTASVECHSPYWLKQGFSARHPQAGDFQTGSSTKAAPARPNNNKTR